MKFLDQCHSRRYVRCRTCLPPDGLPAAPLATLLASVQSERGLLNWTIYSTAFSNRALLSALRHLSHFFRMLQHVLLPIQDCLLAKDPLMGPLFRRNGQHTDCGNPLIQGNLATHVPRWEWTTFRQLIACRELLGGCHYSKQGC